MADDPGLAGRAQLRLDGGTVLAALVVLAVGLAGAGSGFVNGDAAVYAAQGWQHDLASRPVHLGYILVANALASVAGARLPLWLDAVAGISCAATTLGTGVLAASLERRPPWLAAVVAGAMLLPIASFGEVDPLWVALAVWAAAVPSTRVAVGLAMLAVTVSPLALLALPWVSTLRWSRAVETTRREEGVPSSSPTRGLWIGALLAVVALTTVSFGQWWTGPRGVLHAPSPRPLRTLGRWLHEGFPWLAAPLAVVGWVTGGGPGLVAPVPLLLAPTDTDGWALWSVSLALIAARGASTVGWRRLLGVGLVGLALLQPLWGLHAWWAHRRAVRRGTAVTERVLAAMGPEDGLVAAWSWGARASVIAKGAPYALPWRVPGPPVRPPGPWCRRSFDTVWLLPPDLPLPAGWARGAVETSGLVRVPGDVVRASPLPGCGAEAAP